MAEPTVTGAHSSHRAGRPRLRLRHRLSLRAQLVAIIALLATAVAVGLVVVVQIALAGAADKETARVLEDRATQLVASIRTASTGSSIRVPRAQLDPGVAVFDAAGRQVAGSVPPSMVDEFGRLSRATAPRVLEGGEHFAIMAKPFATPAGTRGVVVITEPLAPYERNERAALVVSLVAGGLLVLIASGSAAWTSRRVLSPVEHMARTAAEWSEHDLERRFALGPPTNEIRALGDTLDGLLEKVASVIRAEQRLTAELAHELRTPLTAISGAVDLLAMRTDLDEQAQEDLALIKNATRSMSQTITVLLDVARHDAGGVRLDRTSLADLAAELRALPLADCRLSVDRSLDGAVDGLDVGGDLDAALWVNVPKPLALRAIAPLVDNAAALSARIRVSARARGRYVDILVADDGPGVPQAWADSLFEPGWSRSGGSGLGLSLAQRVARSGGGEVTLLERHNAHGGATFAVTFPGGPAGGL